MSESVRELAKEIQKTRPNATIPVIIELKRFSQKNVDTLVSKGFKVRTIIKELNMVTGEIPAKIVDSIQSLGIVETLSISSELEVL